MDCAFILGVLNPGTHKDRSVDVDNCKIDPGPNADNASTQREMSGKRKAVKQFQLQSVKQC